MKVRGRLFSWLFLALAVFLSSGFLAVGFLLTPGSSAVRADPEEKGQRNRFNCPASSTRCGNYCYWPECLACNWCCGRCVTGVGCARSCGPLEVATTECAPCRRWIWHLFDYSPPRTFEVTTPDIIQAVDLSFTPTSYECLENGAVTTPPSGGPPLSTVQSRAGWFWDQFTPSPVDLDAFGLREPSIGPDPGSYLSLLDVLVSLSDQQAGVLVYSGLPPGHGVQYRFWAYDGTDQPNNSYRVFSDYSSGSSVRVPRPGIYAFQVRSVDPRPVPTPGQPTATTSYGGRSEVVYRLMGSDQIFNSPLVSGPRPTLLPYDALHALLTPAPPPTATPLPTPTGGPPLPVAPLIDTVEAHPTIPGAVNVNLLSSFSGQLQVRYWRHTGFLPPARFHVREPRHPQHELRDAEETFDWNDVPGCSPCSSFVLDGGFAEQAHRDRGDLSLPLFWDFQVRVVDSLGRPGDPSNVVVLGYELPPPIP